MFELQSHDNSFVFKILIVNPVLFLDKNCRMVASSLAQNLLKQVQTSRLIRIPPFSKEVTPRTAHREIILLSFIFKVVVRKPSQSFLFLAILVPFWFIMIPLVFFILI